ncbi:MAG: PHP domain-containing protein [Bacteroidetes bacterium]|nr:PHP domain-containing protein [Bacteroidota bacterium]MCH8524169.1 PHP domain-containing protein [Balneolales bacterium]
MTLVPKADLHVHTTASDGKFSPQQVIDLAVSKGLKGLSITDHDSIEGYLSMREYAQQKDIELLSGVEISCDYNGREAHVLAYGFDATSADLQQMLREQRQKRTTRSKQIISKLNTLGFDIEYDEVRAEAGKASISRNHIADVMRQKFIVASRKEAFDRFLYTGGPAYVQNGYITVNEAIELVHQCGGVCVLAHPGPYYIFEDLRYFLNAGIDGMEYIHPSHNFQTQKKIKDYAENYNLLLTGGSDFHGIKPFEEQMIGTVCVDLTRLDKIQERCTSRYSLNI